MFKVKPPLNLQGEVGPVNQTNQVGYLDQLSEVLWVIVYVVLQPCASESSYQQTIQVSV